MLRSLFFLLPVNKSARENLSNTLASDQYMYLHRHQESAGDEEHRSEDEGGHERKTTLGSLQMLQFISVSQHFGARR